MSSEVETSLDISDCSVIRNVQRLLDFARNDKTDVATAGCGHTCERIEDSMINERRFERSESRQPRIPREEASRKRRGEKDQRDDKRMGTVDAMNTKKNVIDKTCGDDFRN